MVKKKKPTRAARRSIAKAHRPPQKRDPIEPVAKDAAPEVAEVRAHKLAETGRDKADKLAQTPDTTEQASRKSALLSTVVGGQAPDSTSVAAPAPSGTDLKAARTAPTRRTEPKRPNIAASPETPATPGRKLDPIEKPIKSKQPSVSSRGDKPSSGPVATAKPARPAHTRPANVRSGEAGKADDTPGEHGGPATASSAAGASRPGPEGVTKSTPGHLELGPEPSAPAVAREGEAGERAGLAPVDRAVASAPAQPTPGSGDAAVSDGGPASEGGFLVAARPFQDFTTETQRMARESLDETTKLLGQMRGARNPAEIVFLQTTYMQHTLRMYTEFATRVGALFAASQSNLVKQGHATIEGFVPTGKR